MTPYVEQAVYRLREYRRRGEVPKEYRRSYQVLDEGSGQLLAECDLIGRAVFAELAIADQQGNAWHVRPNRRIMPSRWSVTDPQQRVVVQIDQKILGKVVNPLYKTALVLEDGAGKELYRLVDPRTSLPDRVLGAGPGEWALLDGERPVAKLVSLPRPTKPGKGLLGKLRRWLSGSERGIRSAGTAHVLPAPVALAMLLIFDELTDTSGG